MVYILLYNKGSQNEGIHTIDCDEYTQVLFFEVESAAIAYAEKLVAKNFPKPSVELISRIEIEDFCKKEGYEPKFAPADFLPHNEKDYLMVEPPEKMLTSPWQGSLVS